MAIAILSKTWKGWCYTFLPKVRKFSFLINDYLYLFIYHNKYLSRITSPNPQAREVFMKDVNDTYDRIRERCQIMAAEKTQKPQPAKQVEQIQIEVTDPNMSLNVRVPDEN